MCGICGVIQVTGEPRHVIEPAVLDWMTDTMTIGARTTAVRMRPTASRSVYGG